MRARGTAEWGIIQGVLIDLFTGKVERVDVEHLADIAGAGNRSRDSAIGDSMMTAKRIGLIPIALAVAVAEALKATKLIFITTHARWFDSITAS